jgi:YjjG family noncanonical pyrimidine nucleotidase
LSALFLTKYRHIFFDLDHTLWDFEANSVETLHELFDDFELAQKTRTEHAEVFIERYVYHNERMWDLYRKNRMSKSRLRKARFEAALQDVGNADKRLAKELGFAYLERCPQKTKLHEGAMEVLENLANDHVMHILSNGFHETQLVKLKAAKLEPFFRHIITSEKANAKKPDPRIYAFAEKLTGAQASESVMIGDNLEIDVKGALDFGWSAVHFNPHEPQSNGHCVSSLRQLPALLRGE